MTVIRLFMGQAPSLAAPASRSFSMRQPQDIGRSGTKVSGLSVEEELGPTKQPVVIVVSRKRI